ncbi:MAG: AtpZ/AtpI family protein [Cyclobacteriaceae bacterium]
MESDQKNQKQLSPFLKYSSLAIQMAAAIGFAAWVGFRLDQKWGTTPIVLITLIVSTFAGIIYKLRIDLNKER